MRRFNKLATVLVKYEVVNYHKWCKGLETASDEFLQSPLLLWDAERAHFIVNPLSTTLTIIQESKSLIRLGLKTPKVARDLLLREKELKSHADWLVEAKVAK